VVDLGLVYQATRGDEGIDLRRLRRQPGHGVVERPQGSATGRA
jgi:hypothetical protein